MGKKIAICVCGQKPKCCLERKDCFARNRVGNCEALEDTRFASGNCPFYKTGPVVASERVQVKERLVRLERADLILRYKVD